MNGRYRIAIILVVSLALTLGSAASWCQAPTGNDISDDRDNTGGGTYAPPLATRKGFRRPCWSRGEPAPAPVTAGIGLPLLQAGLSDTRPVIDGEICSLDKKDARSLKICYFTLEISVFSCVRFVDA